MCAYIYIYYVLCRVFVCFLWLVWYCFSNGWFSLVCPILSLSLSRCPILSLSFCPHTLFVFPPPPPPPPPSLSFSPSTYSTLCLSLLRIKHTHTHNKHGRPYIYRNLVVRIHVVIFYKLIQHIYYLFVVVPIQVWNVLLIVVWIRHQLVLVHN